MFSKSLQIASKKNVVLHYVPELFAVFPVFLEESSFLDDYSIDWIFSRTFQDIKKVNIKRPGRSAIEKAVISIALKFPIDRALDTKKCLDKVDVLLKKYPVEESKWIINFMGQTSFKYTEMIEKSIYGKDTWYAFENIKLLGPEKYDQYLKSLYGDYMTPPKDADKNAHVSELVKQEEK